MAHFQLPVERRRYGTRLGGTRLFLSGSSGPEAIFVEEGSTVTLEIAGAGNTSPAITQLALPKGPGVATGLLAHLVGKPSGLPDVVSIDVLGRRVKLKGLRPGLCVLTVGGTGLLVAHVGRFQNHTGLDHDLIADVFRSADPEKMHTLVRMLTNDPENLFNENSDANVRRWGHLACGTVSKVGGAAVFYDKVDYDYKPYYKTPIAGKTRKDVVIDSVKLDRGRDAIADRLAKGMPSIVGLIYAPSAIQKGRVNVTGTGGHTVLIVGCSTDRKTFLYIDVWQGGSKLKYTGGYPGQPVSSTECESLGLFTLRHDAARGVDILRSTTPGPDPVFNGPNFLEVVAGPLG